MTTRNQSGRILIILGFITIGVMILLFGKYQDPILYTPDAIDEFQRMANGFYIVYLIAFGAIAF